MITSKSNKWLKLVREVRRGKARDLWLVEGARATLEALHRGLRALCILADPDRLSAEELETLSRSEGERLNLIAGSLLDEVADQDSPRGLVALFPRYPLSLAERSAESGLHLYADRIQDPRNLGALIRVGMAFGARSIFVSDGSCSANHPRVVRSSAGLVVGAPVFEGMTISLTLDHLKKLDPLVAALDALGNKSLPEVRFPSSVLVLVGTEGQGLGEDLLAISTVTLSIPISPAVESLNLATAAAIACYEFRRQRP